MNIIILGNGQLGSFLFKNLKLNECTVDVIDYPDFDITNQEMIKNVVKKYDLIINAAAYTLVDKAETDKLNCYMINSLGPILLASECIKNDRKFVHISSEVVYGSNNESYVPISENHEKMPVCEYAKSKMIADEYIENLNDPHILLLRSGWLFGPNNDHNFIEKICKLLLSRDEIKVVDDQIGTLSYVGLLLRAIAAFIKGDLPAGIYNVGNAGFPSRYEVACFIKDQLKSECVITRCDSTEFKRIANVAKNSCLDCSKIKKYVQIDETWKEDVLKVLNERHENH